MYCHPEKPDPRCPLCARAARDPAFAAAVARVGAPGEKPAPAANGGKVVALPVVPCGYEGKELTGPERQAAKLGHARRWTRCDHPKRPLGEFVCRCKGCGPRCKGYVSGSPPDAEDVAVEEVGGVTPPR